MLAGFEKLTGRSQRAEVNQPTAEDALKVKVKANDADPAGGNNSADQRTETKK